MKRFLDKFTIIFILISPILDVLTSFQIKYNKIYNRYAIYNLYCLGYFELG